MNQILNMIFRMAMRKIIGRGVNAGIDAAFGGSDKSKKDMTPEERRTYDRSRQTARRAKQAGKVIRRLGR